MVAPYLKILKQQQKGERSFSLETLKVTNDGKQTRRSPLVIRFFRNGIHTNLGPVKTVYDSLPLVLQRKRGGIFLKPFPHTRLPQAMFARW
mmetsp:Transcript_19278/g.23716  ORF Transcript_19278/g.23716 Transcript_19278/m.23716 type:complete len:91 (-) Transcript_19278:10-282(-)